MSTQVRISVGCQSWTIGPLEESMIFHTYNRFRIIRITVRFRRITGNRSGSPTVVVSVLPILAANTGNQRCARPSTQLWPRLEPTVGPNLANCFRWSWQFSRPTSGPRLNQSSAYYQLYSVDIAWPTVGPTVAQTRTDCRANCSRQWTKSVIISLVGPTSGQLGWTKFNKVGPTVDRRSIRTWEGEEDKNILAFPFVKHTIFHDISIKNSTLWSKITNIL